MRLEEFKKQFVVERDRIKSGAGGVVVADAGGGSVGIGTIEGIVSVLEDQERRIAAIERGNAK